MQATTSFNTNQEAVITLTATDSNGQPTAVPSFIVVYMDSLWSNAVDNGVLQPPMLSGDVVTLKAKPNAGSQNVSIRSSTLPELRTSVTTSAPPPGPAANWDGTVQIQPLS